MIDFRLSDSSEDPVIDEAFSKTREWLTIFAADEMAIQKLSPAFGDYFDTNKLRDLLNQWVSGNFTSLPTIELLPGAEINQANGAFAAQNNTVYLSQEYVSQNSKNSGAIANVLLEGIGHFTDYQVNVADSLGDEGAIFAAVAQGVWLGGSTLQALKTEDDSVSVILNGQVIQIEQNSLSGIPVTDAPKVLDLDLLIAAAVIANPVAGITLAIANEIFDIDERTAGWVWVDPNQKYQSVTGVVKTRIDGENDEEQRVGTSSASEKGKPGSFVSYTDLPSAHDSHDQNTIIQVDPEYEFLLSQINKPGQLEIEWETGIRPDEHDSS